MAVSYPKSQHHEKHAVMANAKKEKKEFLSKRSKAALLSMFYLKLDGEVLRVPILKIKVSRPINALPETR